MNICNHIASSISDFVVKYTDACASYYIKYDVDEKFSLSENTQC